jgi:hypothetical protein
MGKEQDIVDKDERFWIREDGALCWGAGCLVIKPDGKDLRITVNEESCGGLALEAYGKLIEDTIGKGGKTVYEVPAKIEQVKPQGAAIAVKPKGVKK